jgi:prolyl oligopeptidase PreP (S9A serine peptidase family)
MISKYELQNVISGTGGGPKSNFIKAAARYLSAGEEAGRETQAVKQSKVEESKKLIEWADKNEYWYFHFAKKRYLTRGAEQRVYLDFDPGFVIKINDAIFYENWSDYLISLLIHNYFFPNTAYELMGFFSENGILYAVVKQQYIKINQPTDLEKVRLFLIANGFENNRNNDYFQNDLGLILEDIHDENVLMNDGVLFFVDTVFYVK